MRQLFSEAVRAMAFGALAAGAFLVSSAVVGQRAYSDDMPVLDFGDNYVDHPEAERLWQGWTDPFDRFWNTSPGPCYWSIDYRFRGLCESMTAYEFGTGPGESPVYSPISRLKFPLNSCWHGLKVGVDRPTWASHFEWMMPQQGIQGDLKDYDWRLASQKAFTDLGYADERWTEGQMIDLDLEFLIWDRPFNWPLQLWPIGGFRWQRFDIMTYDLTQVKFNNVWLDPPYRESGNIISFNQQYYTAYIGGQIRTKFDESSVLAPITVTLQGDWGHVEAYNIDHHLVREGDRFTMDRTAGDAWHTALIVEAMLNLRLSVGFQADYTEIFTTGTHRYVNQPLDVDESWTNGVRVTSHQTWMTAFVRLRI
ncbi:MAG: omptin family outer membrane protease [Thermoguttaceae bacterium]